MKVRIELIVPDDMDPSDILERMQTLALEWHEEHEDPDEEHDDTAYRSEIENAVSVEIIREPKASR